MRSVYRFDFVFCYVVNGGRRVGIRFLSRGMLIRSSSSCARSLLRLKVSWRRRTCGRSRFICCSSSVSSRSNISSFYWVSRCSRRRSCFVCDRCLRVARVSFFSRFSSFWVRDSEGGGVSRVRILAFIFIFCFTEIGEIFFFGVFF